MKSALKFLSGSAATYFLMAACADAPKHSHAKAAGGKGQMATGGDDRVAQGGSPSSGGTTTDAMDDAGWGGTSGSYIDTAGVFGTMTDPIRDASAEPATDGTRLKAIYQVGSDGSRQQLLSWWDSDRDEECSYITFSDGSARCVPSVTAFATTFFSDSGCSAPLFYTATGQCQATAAKYAILFATTGCNAGSYSGIYSLKVVAPGRVFTGTPAACTDAGAATLAAYTFYTGRELSLSSFVTATKEHG